MHARVFTFQVKHPEQAEQLFQFFQQNLFTISKQYPGFTDALNLLDRQAGKIISVSLWESEEQARSFDTNIVGAEEAAQLASLLTGAPTDEIYEVC
jgi:heme-degrading monooxygenase HmoA